MPNIDIPQLLHDLHNYNINCNTREIFITGYVSDSYEEDPGIEYRSTGTFIKNLRFMESLNHNEITIHMQIGGGFWDECMAMYDAIQLAKSPIKMIAYAQASSASGVLLQAAPVRLMMPNTHFMLHYGSISLPDYSSHAASEAIMHNNKECNRMLDIFAKRAIKGPYFVKKGWDYKKVSSYIDKQMKLKQDWYLDAGEAVDYGFADGVFGVDN